MAGFDVTLGIAEAEINEVDVPAQISDSALFFHALEVSTPYNAVLLSVYPRSRAHSVEVFVRFGQQPTLDQYNIRRTVSGVEG